MAFTTLVFTLAATSARAEGSVMGTGSWPCSEIVVIMETGDPSLVGQVAGWVFGYWSGATFRREADRVGILEEVDEETILRKAV
ncbi:MAG TPA: hypothetical protein DIU07_19355 [Rhodobacteraceae bacterium]|nr:hypothetical protein [Paracoccaceae bacterium]